MIAESIATKAGLRILRANFKLSAANSSPMKCAGKCHVKMTFEGVQIDTAVLITPDLQDEILVGKDDLIKLRVIDTAFPHRHVRTGLVSSNLMDGVERLKGDFADVFSDTLKATPMTGAPMHIHLKDNCVPTRMLVARQYPINMAKAANEAVNKLKETVLREVHEPTDWIAPGFFVLKGDPMVKKAMREGLSIITVDDLRLVVDYTGLNKWVKRPVHTFPSSKDILDRIPAGSTVFCKLDCVQGYHQIELDEESSRMTTSLLPNGRFMFTRTPMGLNASLDGWCRRSDEAVQGIEGVQKIVDDILVCGSSMDELLERVRQVLTRCREHNLTISKKKFYIGDEVKFAGHRIAKDGIRPDPDLVKSIPEYPAPKDKTQLRRFLGMANQFGAFAPDIAHMSSNLRPLTSSTKAFVWLDAHDSEFNNMKKLLSSDMVVEFFDCRMPTMLMTDASRLHGVGFALMQQGADNRMHLISCGSRSLSPAETRYATIELECLALTWAIRKCRQFLLGMHEFTVITDHRPLVGIFNKAIDETTNTRLIRMRERVTAFSFRVVWKEGKNNLIADALSRAPVFSPDEEDRDNEDCIKINLVHKASDPQLQSLFDAAHVDGEYQDIKAAILAGSTMKSLPPTHAARPYVAVWDRISVFEDTLLVVDGHRIIPPRLCRPDLMNILHAAHAGINRTLAAATQRFYWPNMKNDIVNVIDRCEDCQELRPSQPLEEDITTVAAAPMEQVGIDLFQMGTRHFLVMVDRFSGFPFVAELRSLTTAAVIKRIKSWFLDFGFAARIRSDQGPQFRSEFDAFCHAHGIIHESSSPYNPRSNGLAEAAVKNCKYLLRKHKSFDAFLAGLLEFRNTPRSSGPSPASLFFGRNIRTALPGLPPPTVPKSDRTIVETFHKGERVRVQDARSKLWNIKGEILDVCQSRRSYVIKTDDGTVIQRNRRFIKSL